MKNKTSKLRKLENNRYSILTNELDICFICSSPATEIHEIYGGKNRKMSMLNGFCIPLCRKCHQRITIDNEMSKELKSECQEEFEKQREREEFIKIIGANYL